MEIKGKIYNPATGEELADRFEHSFKELQNAIRTSKIAQRSWAEVPIKVRAKIIRKILLKMNTISDELARTISESTGKTVIDALSTEVLSGMIAIRYYCKVAPKILQPEKTKRSSIIFFNKRSLTLHEPLGVVGIISPWNYPFIIPFHETIMALLAGNGVILKVASQAQLVGDFIKDLISSLELPDGLFSLIHMPGIKAGNAFLVNNIDKLFYTGSVETGKKLMARASDTLTPVCLELGGDDPMIVLEDAHISRAINGVLWAGFSNCGQSCGGVERLYVHEKIYEDFSLRLKKAVEGLRRDNGIRSDYDTGYLTTEKQRNILQEHIRDAIDKGANILAQSEPMDSGGHFFPATVLTNVDNSMRIQREETFGPVITIDSFKTDKEALDKANNSNLGLTASIWTRDKKRARNFAQKLEAGTITINDHLMTHGMPETPWGGFKYSGMGRTHGKEGLLEMTRIKSVTKDLLPSMPRNLWWYPYNHELHDILKAIKVFLSGQCKISVLFRIIFIFIKRMISRN